MRFVVTRSEVREQLVRFASEIAGIPAEEITDAATIDRELRLESVAFIELQVALEEHYRIEIDPILIVQLNRVGAIVDYVYGQVVGEDHALLPN